MILPAIKLSLLVTGCAIVWITLLGGALGLFLARTYFRGKEILDALLTLPMVLPPTVTGYYLIVLLGREGFLGKLLFEKTGISITFHWIGAVIAATVVSLPLMIRASRSAFEGVPKRLEEASAILGKNKLWTLLQITIPLAKQGLQAGILLSFARALGEFGATLMLAGNIPGQTQTMPLAIYEALLAGEEETAQVLVFLLTLFSVGVIYFTNQWVGKPMRS